MPYAMMRYLIPKKKEVSVKLKPRYPKLVEAIGDDDLEMRHVLSIDENYYDFDSEEFEYDPEDYNYIVYVAEPLQKLIGNEGLEALAKYLESLEEVQDFVAGEEDLFALKTEKDDAFLAECVLRFCEEYACDAS
jgi:hypothetical protein